jgi:hypothetical protein
MKVASDALLSALRTSRHPNCTLYLIWHYVSNGDMAAARQEFAWDHDKLGGNRKLVESIVSDNRVIEPTSPKAGEPALPAGKDA